MRYPTTGPCSVSADTRDAYGLYGSGRGLGQGYRDSTPLRHNKPLVDALDAMCAAGMRAGEDPKRTNAYSKALASIRALQVEVTSGAKIAKSGSDKVPNVGPSIGAQIDYFLANGVFERHAFYEKGQLPPS